MLTLQTGKGQRDCSGISRRDFMRVGALGLGGLQLPGLLASKAHAVASGLDYVKDKSVVLLYLSGGASHIETFNPNMGAPSPYRSLTGEVKTTLPGVTFGGTFPALARHAHEMAVIRSFSHPIGGHGQAHVHVLSGGTDPRGDGKNGFSIGSAYSRLRGPNHEKTGLPTYQLLVSPEIDGQYKKELGRVIKGSWPGSFGSSFAPYRYETQGILGKPDPALGKSRKNSSSPGKTGLAADMHLNLPEDRLEDRRHLLGQIDRLRHDLDVSGKLESADEYHQRAYDLLLGSAAESFNLSDEDPRLIERYDTSAMPIGHKVFRKSTLGHQMLLSRRLVEAGAGFVTVHSAGWDMHADSNNPGMVKGMNMLGTTLDRAVSAFLDDIAQRGLSEKVLLVVTGDFGRTPTVNKKGGRDHWARLGTLAFAGGGLKMGQVIGASDKRNGEPYTDAVTPAMMMGTILHTLFDVGKIRIEQGLPADLSTFVNSLQTIPELV
jgi:hypothetical protein